MGASQKPVRVVIIDNHHQEQDFHPLQQDNRIDCSYETTFGSFLENQSLKDLPYLIIRQHKLKDDSKEWSPEVAHKIKQSSLVAKTYANYRQLNSQFGGKRLRINQCLREQLIAYIRKYHLQKLVIYILVESVFDYKIPEHEEPYIFMISQNMEQIKASLLTKPEGAESLNFKFRRMVKDLYRRTVVRILNTQTDQQKAKELKKEWGRHLGSKITSNFTDFNEEGFRSNLISNYYDFIVVTDSYTFTFVMDMKKVHKFQSEIIYHGDIQQYGEGQYQSRTQEKVTQVKESLWMFSQNIQDIALAINNCTDILAEETTLVATNLIIYTHQSYGEKLEGFIVERLTEYLTNPPESMSKRPSKDITDSDWVKNMHIKVVSGLHGLKNYFKRSTFSYLVTLDCNVNEIETVKTYLRQEQYDKRVYLYSADEKPGKVDSIRLSGKEGVIEQYLDERVKAVVMKAGFKVKFQIGPVDAITTYKATAKVISKFTSELGLMTANISSYQEFTNCYLSGQQDKIISGFLIVMKAEDYFTDYKKLLEQDLKEDPRSYLQKVKVIIWDKEAAVREYWDQIKVEIRNERIDFAHYNFIKIENFLDIMVTPRINLTIFIKKALPNFYKAYQKIAENKFRPIELTASIVSKNELLKEVFDDENFQLSKLYQVSFLKLTNSNKNLDQALTVLHEEYLLRYSMMWRLGYTIVARGADKPLCIQSLKQDITFCLFRCKSYHLIDVSEQEFDYFYINRLKQCETYIDLQITVIYIFSLQHGLANVIQRIFADPLFTCLTAKVFSGFMVTLFSAFCSFEDEVMNKKRFLIYIDSSNFEEFRSIMGALKIGDYLFNRCFLLSGKDNGKSNNNANNCLFLEFEDIPMLSETHVENYLNIERFSFYKENTEYLIAPYTEFIVKNIENTSEGKVHVTLSATTNSKKGFVAKVFAANSINEEELLETIKEQVCIMSNVSMANQTRKIREIESLYKKAELVGLYKQKVELMRSIEEGLEYKNFLQAIRKNKYMSALSHLKKKEQTEKTTTEIQASYFKNMLGVEKSMLYYNMCEYNMSIRELDKVIKYLNEQNIDEGENWVTKKLKNYKQSVKDLKNKRQKYLNRLDKVKHWSISGSPASEEQPKLQTKMEEKTMVWKVGYQPKMEEFYIQREGKQQLYHYNMIPAFGDLATAFPSNSTYQTITERKKAEQERHLERKNQEDRQFSPKITVRRQESMDSELSPVGKKEKQTTNLIRTESILQSQLTAHLVESPASSTSKLVKQESFNFDILEEPEVSQLKMHSIAEEHEKSTPMNQSMEQPMVKITSATPNVPVQVKEDVWAQPSSNLPHKIESQLSDGGVSESEMQMGVREVVNWQCFFFDGKVVLTKKGKHYKVKVPNKYHF